MRKYCFTFVIVTALPCPTALGQQEHPNRATGERSETLYAQSGQDEINLFNGSLSYRIPIGEGVQAGPNIRLAPVLVYNTTPLRTWNLGCSPPPGTRVEEAYPSGDRIFGHGWQMHFGRVVPVAAVQLQALVDSCSLTLQGPAPNGGGPAQPLVVTMISTGWGYQEPDGAVHEFFDRQTESVPPIKNCFTDARATGEHCFVYTHDGSYIRMDPKDPEYGLDATSTPKWPTIYLPDGTRRVMKFRGGRRPASFGATRDDLFYSEPAPDRSQGYFPPPAFHTTEIADPFGNKIIVRYFGDVNDPNYAPNDPIHPQAHPPGRLSREPMGRDPVRGLRRQLPGREVPLLGP